MSNEIFFKRTARICLSGAYRYFGVKKKSYAGTIVARLFDYFCRDANNLCLEYLIYYRKEFSDFESFLEKRYNLFPEEIESIKSIRLCHKSFSFEADGNVTYLLEDEAIKETFEKYIGEHIYDN